MSLSSFDNSFAELSGFADASVTQGVTQAQTATPSIGGTLPRGEERHAPISSLKTDSSKAAPSLSAPLPPPSLPPPPSSAGVVVEEALQDDEDDAYPTPSPMLSMDYSAPIEMDDEDSDVQDGDVVDDGFGGDPPKTADEQRNKTSSARSSAPPVGCARDGAANASLSLDAHFLSMQTVDLSVGANLNEEVISQDDPFGSQRSQAVVPPAGKVRDPISLEPPGDGDHSSEENHPSIPEHFAWEASVALEWDLEEDEEDDAEDKVAVVVNGDDDVDDDDDDDVDDVDDDAVHNDVVNDDIGAKAPLDSPPPRTTPSSRHRDKGKEPVDEHDRTSSSTRAARPSGSSPDDRSCKDAKAFATFALRRKGALLPELPSKAKKPTFVKPTRRPGKRSASTTSPKKPLSAYLHFCKDQRPSIMAKHPDASFGRVGKLLGEAWRSASAQVREHYEAISKADASGSSTKSAESRIDPMARPSSSNRDGSSDSTSRRGAKQTARSSTIVPSSFEEDPVEEEGDDDDDDTMLTYESDESIELSSHSDDGNDDDDGVSHRPNDDEDAPSTPANATEWPGGGVAADDPFAPSMQLLADPGEGLALPPLPHRRVVVQPSTPPSPSPLAVQAQWQRRRTRPRHPEEQDNEEDSEFQDIIRPARPHKRRVTAAAAHNVFAEESDSSLPSSSHHTEEDGSPSKKKRRRADAAPPHTSPQSPLNDQHQDGSMEIVGDEPPPKEASNGDALVHVSTHHHDPEEGRDDGTHGKKVARKTSSDGSKQRARKHPKASSRRSTPEKSSRGGTKRRRSSTPSPKKQRKKSKEERMCELANGITEDTEHFGWTERFAKEVRRGMHGAPKSSGSSKGLFGGVEFIITCTRLPEAESEMFLRLVKQQGGSILHDGAKGRYGAINTVTVGGRASKRKARGGAPNAPPGEGKAAHPNDEQPEPPVPPRHRRGGGGGVGDEPSSSKDHHQDAAAREGSSWSVPPVVLLSSGPCRTKKYLIAVASGTPCVHYNWILHCAKQRVLLPYTPYLLPSGYSLKASKYVTIQRRNETLFDGVRIEVIGSTGFRETWARVLREGGAKVVQRLFTPQEHRVEMILCDGAPSQFMFEKFEELNVPIVSPDWCFECLLQQMLVPPEQDSRYTWTWGEDAGSSSTQTTQQ